MSAARRREAYLQVSQALLGLLNGELIRREWHGELRAEIERIADAFEDAGQLEDGPGVDERASGDGKPAPKGAPFDEQLEAGND